MVEAAGAAAIAREALGPATQAAAVRDRIMDVAAGLFLQQGYRATSLRHIAGAVGMKAGSLYYHFASKDDLLEAIFRRGMDVMVEAFRHAAAETLGQTPRVRLEAHVRAHLAALFENGPFTAVHVTAFRTAPDSVCRAIVPVRDDYEAMWTRLLEEWVADGTLASQTPVGLVRLILFGSMNSAIEWFDPERGTLDVFAATLAGQFWSGAAVAPAPGGRR
jgi:AcrR family transcriptional regulator